MTKTQQVLNKLNEMYVMTEVKIVKSMIAENFIFAKANTVDVAILISHDSDVDFICSPECLF